MRRTIASLSLMAMVGLAACGSSSTTTIDLSTLDRTNVNSGLVPLSNGFSFANFGATVTSEQFDVNDLVTMFGAGACIDGIVDPCEPTAQAAAWARMVNDARQSGHCEGLVVQASARFNDRVEPRTADLGRETEVIHGVFRAFATQFLPEVQDSTKQWANRSLIDIVNELVDSLADGSTDYSMGLYSDQGGHAVLPYSVEFTDDDLAIIRVYDSNWPGMERYVIVDFVKNEWFFSFSGRDPQADECVWSGGPGDIDLTPLASRTNAQCPFCGDKSTVTKSMLLIRSATDDWSVTTEDGTFSPNSEQGVEGVTARAIRSSTCTDKTRLPEFIIATRSLRVQVTLPNDATAYVSNGRSVVEIKTKGKKNRNPIVIEENRITINDPDTTTTVSNGNLAAVVQAPQARVSLVNDNIEVEVDNGSTTENIVVDRDAPRQSISTRGEQVVVEDATTQTNTVTPDVPQNLQQDAQPASLPPSSERDLNNVEYAEEVAAAATSTTTTIPRSTTTVRNSNSTTSTTTTTKAPSIAAAPTTTTTSTSTTTSTTTTTIPKVTIRIVIEDGEGGIRFGSTPNSWGNPVWYNPANDQINEMFPSCGPGSANLCNGRSYEVPLGMNFIFDWALYNDVYLYEMQCGTGQPWINPQGTYGVNSEVRSLGRCEWNNVSTGTTFTFRQR